MTKSVKDVEAALNPATSHLFHPDGNVLDIIQGRALTRCGLTLSAFELKKRGITMLQDAVAGECDCAMCLEALHDSKR